MINALAVPRDERVQRRRGEPRRRGDDGRRGGGGRGRGHGRWGGGAGAEADGQKQEATQAERAAHLMASWLNVLRFLAKSSRDISE